MGNITLEFTNSKGLNCSALLYKINDLWWAIGSETCFWYEQNSSGSTLKEIVENQISLFEDWKIPELIVTVE